MIDETWYRRPPDTPLGVASGGVVVRREAGVLLVALVAEAGYSHYILPKGGVEPGETLEQAARREILEEAGLDDLELLGRLGVRERLNFKKKTWKITHYFLFRARRRGGPPRDPRRAYRCEWFPLDALPPMFWPEQRALLEEFRPLITHLAGAGASEQPLT